MAIKPSAAAEIRTLVDALASQDDVRREAAVARLAVIGARAIDRLTKTYADPATTRQTRVAILRVLERTADPRTLPLARRALEEGGDVAAAGALALKPLLTASNADVASGALDALVTAALNRDGEHRVRSAAVDALQEMSHDVRVKVAAALGATTRIPRGESLWQDALEGRLPDDPAAFRDAVDAHGGQAALSDLQRLVDASREKERNAGEAARALGWRSVRGAIHQTLGLRQSTVAVYDLRETLAASAEALPATFIAALHAVGDASCLEPLAAAYSKTADERWRHQLAGAFQAIVTRHKVAPASAAMKRVQKRWPDAAARLSKTSRTTPPRKNRART